MWDKKLPSKNYVLRCINFELKGINMSLKYTSYFLRGVDNVSNFRYSNLKHFNFYQIVGEMLYFDRTSVKATTKGKHLIRVKWCKLELDFIKDIS